MPRFTYHTTTGRLAGAANVVCLVIPVLDAQSIVVDHGRSKDDQVDEPYSSGLYYKTIR